MITETPSEVTYHDSRTWLTAVSPVDMDVPYASAWWHVHTTSLSLVTSISPRLSAGEAVRDDDVAARPFGERRHPRQLEAGELVPGFVRIVSRFLMYWWIREVASKP